MPGTLPPKSWDCHVHVAGDPALYPVRIAGPLPPAEASADALDRLHRAAGIERGVIVQPHFYARDHRLLVDTLKTRPNYRGIALLDESIDEREMRRLHDSGIRGARFVFWRRMEQAPSPAFFRLALARMAALGWHAKIHAVGEEWDELGDLFAEVRIPAVIEHMANLDLARGENDPGFRFIEKMASRENWWVLVSNGHRRSALAEGFDDVVPIAQRIVALAPDRAIWASDWPHLGYTKRTPRFDELLDLLSRCAPDPAVRHKVLVENPARLLGLS